MPQSGAKERLLLLFILLAQKLISFRLEYKEKITFAKIKNIFKKERTIYIFSSNL